MINKQFFLSLALLLCSNLAYAKSNTSVDLNDANIRFLGTNYIYHDSNSVSFTRHSKETLEKKSKELNFNPIKAQSTSGIVVNLATDSNNINFSFMPIAPINRGSEFALYENNSLVKTYKFTPKQKRLAINYQSKIEGEKEYRLTLPSFTNVALTAIEIDQNSKLTTIKTPRKGKYIAIGDSITHGVGQGSATHLTYPYILAQGLDLELFNLAVGGGKVSIPTAKMLKDFSDIELITILIGYNDWNSPRADVKVYQQNLEQLIDITRNLHPEAKIYCITPLFTNKELSKHSKVSIKPYRQAVIDVVGKKQHSGDTNIALIHGDKITSAKNLREDKPTDPVHLGITGANLLAEELLNIIKL